LNQWRKGGCCFTLQHKTLCPCILFFPFEVPPGYGAFVAINWQVNQIEKHVNFADLFFGSFVIAKNLHAW
jgi:hypothetical protein